MICFYGMFLLQASDKPIICEILDESKQILMNSEEAITQIKTTIRSGLCISCGACVFLDTSRKSFMMHSPEGAVPYISSSAQFDLNPMKYCPGRGIDYAGLYDAYMGGLPQNHLMGDYKSLYTGYSLDPAIRKNSSSGGIISHVLRYLLEESLVDAVLCAKQGVKAPHLSAGVVIKNPDDLASCAQSIYQPTAMLNMLSELDAKKRYAITLIPEQCAILRQMQIDGIPQAQAIKYVIGPYTGTQLQPQALSYFYHKLKISDSQALEYIKWRAGDWPGYLEMKSKAKVVVRSLKIYYNFLIPFYIARSSLTGIDFANEFTDLSVGDAWHPMFEAKGGGHSVVCVRSDKMAQIIDRMRELGKIHLEEIAWEEAGKMHGHMLDFKKRGAFIRIKYMKLFGKAVPKYTVKPMHIGVMRYLVEVVNVCLFALAGNPLSRAVLNYIPEPILGASFNFMRLRWKALSKPTKRKGLADYCLIRVDNEE